METENTSHLNYSAWNNYIPKKRASNEEVAESIRALARHPIVRAILDSSNVEMLVVNPSLQIVAANRKTLANMDASDESAIVGRRFGEVIQCANIDGSGSICGGGDSCKDCGATNCILASMESGLPEEGECVVSSALGNARRITDYSIRATPVKIADLYFTVVALQDISDSKRRSVLERVFIHDLNNTLASLVGWVDELLSNSRGDLKKNAKKIDSLTKRLAHEIEYHRTLTAAEAGELKPSNETVLPTDILSSIEAFFSHYVSSRGQSLIVEKPIASQTLKTDRTLLERVMINMVKNALEAEDQGALVRIGCLEQSNALRFFVSNRKAIPGEARPRIFERSFTTKNESGRGLGTYSMKLFGERILKGRVWFESSESEGTTFFFELPISSQGE